MREKQSSQKLKAYLRQLYAKLAAHGTANLSSAPIACGEELARAFGYHTSVLPIPKKAWRLFAGCGNPLEEIRMGPHWIVLDLGCGVGIDSQVAALSMQPPGRVIGMDITSEMIYQAKGYSNSNPLCHWVTGDGEHLPLRSDCIDLVTANGSFNLLPHKEQALTEINRVLKPGGLLSLVDLIAVGEIAPIIEGFEDAWSWCVAGALTAEEHDLLMSATGFTWRELKVKSSYGPLAAAHLLARKGERG